MWPPATSLAFPQVVLDIIHEVTTNKLMALGSANILDVASMLQRSHTQTAGLSSVFIASAHSVFPFLVKGVRLNLDTWGLVHRTCRVGHSW